MCADRRSYGTSGCPASAPDHAPYAKHAMVHDMVAVRLLSLEDETGFAKGGRTAAMNALFLDKDTLMYRAKRNRWPRRATSGVAGYIASDVIARDLGLELWWHPVNARRSIERRADRESA